MSATLIAPETVSREQLRTFHLSGHGLEGMLPASGLKPSLTDDTLRGLPQLELVYPVWITPGKPPAPNVPGNEGFPAPFSAASLPLIHGAFLAAGRASARAAFLQSLRQAIASLADLIAVDDAKRRPASLDNVAASLGEAQRFLSVGRLMSVFGRHGNQPAGMDAQRRLRCEAALTALEEALYTHQSAPSFWLFSSGESPVDLSAAGGRVCQSTDPCSDALAFVNQQLFDFAIVLRALRLAKLEAVNAYDSATHDEALARFDWQTAEPGEIAALPTVVVLESAERLEAASLTSFSRLLRSGRPVQLLIPSSGLCAGDLTGSVADFGALALAHRGAFVLQTSMANWDHLAAGFTEMALTLHPAVAVVSVPAPGEAPETAWLQACLLSLSPAFPLFRYHPDLEGGWQERFRLLESLPENDSVTPVDALLLSSRYRAHFRMIPPDAWDKEQLELREFLRRYQSAPPLVIPFVNALDDSGALRRLAVTRELVHLCFDRQRAAEMLRVLAAKSPAPTAQAAVVPIEANDSGIREAAAKDAYRRVLALLADPQSLV